MILYIDVGDQKFISLNSLGFAWSGFWVLFDGAGISNASSASSLILDTTDCVDWADSRCMPNKPDKNQPFWLFSPVLVLLANWPVKNGFALAFLIDLGDDNGEAGSDFDPLRPVYLGWDIKSVSLKVSLMLSGASMSLLKLEINNFFVLEVDKKKRMIKKLDILSRRN